MNLFWLDEDPFKSIEYHCDKHVVKMPTEYKQMLCTAHRVLDGTEYYDRTKSGAKIKRWKHPDRKMEKILFKASHVNHPTNKWVRMCRENYGLMFTYYILCCNEYEHRYGKIHGAKDYWDMLREPPKNMPSSVLGHTPVPQAMKQFPECMVEGDTVQAYRNFYNVAKKRFATWKERESSYWYGTERLELRAVELRAKVANLQQENEILRQDLKSLTEAYYGLINRIKEISEEKLDNANIQIQEQSDR